MKSLSNLVNDNLNGSTQDLPVDKDKAAYQNTNYTFKMQSLQAKVIPLNRSLIFIFVNGCTEYPEIELKENSKLKMTLNY